MCRTPRVCSCSRPTGSATSSWRCQHWQIFARGSLTRRWWSQRVEDSRPIFECVPGVDQIVLLDGRHDVNTLRQAGADAVLLLPNSFRSAWLTWRAGVPVRWGYRTQMRDLLLTRGIRPAPRAPPASCDVLSAPDHLAWMRGRPASCASSACRRD